MNPFDLPGPTFLVFYGFLGIAVTVLLWATNRFAESGPRPRLPLHDPYQIAWLCGGKLGAVRVATLSMIDRNLVILDPVTRTVSSGDLVAAPPPQPLERAIFTVAAGTVTASALVSHQTIVDACERHRQQLSAVGLVPTGAMMRSRLVGFMIAMAIMQGTAGAKIYIAVAHGRGNFLFLIILMLVVSFVLAWITSLRRTRIGNRAVADLRRLFAALRKRAGSIQRGEMTSDAMLLTAVFGLDVLPDTGFGALKLFFRRVADQTRRKSSGSDCSSSCGGASGCGGGSGGGCGGCGSS
ncbi:MAG: TIGR04222 domain-containing membrane protein [Aliidongia sp.]|jgi:uncharacterized protein (TIGR04222 family)